MLLVLVRMPVSHPLTMVEGRGEPWDEQSLVSWGLCRVTEGRECEPGPRSPEANFRLGKRRSRAGALLVWQLPTLVWRRQLGILSTGGW